jgi:hypothetical protein
MSAEIGVIMKLFLLLLWQTCGVAVDFAENMKSLKDLKEQQAIHGIERSFWHIKEIMDAIATKNQALKLLKQSPIKISSIIWVTMNKFLLGIPLFPISF